MISTQRLAYRFTYPAEARVSEGVVPEPQSAPEQSAKGGGENNIEQWGTDSHVRSYSTAEIAS